MLYEIQQIIDRKQVSDTLISRVKSREIDGFIVEDFVTEQERQSLLAGFYQMTEKDLVNVVPGFRSYPMAFSQFDQAIQAGKLTDSEYYSNSKQVRDLFYEHFNINLENKISSFLSQAFGGRSVEVPTDIDKTGSFAPFTFRELVEQEGYLMPHCENYFFTEFPGFFRKLSHLTNNENQLSFFLVLSKPTSGGRLVLYDIEWRKANVRQGEDIIEDKDKRQYDTRDENSILRDYIDVNERALVVFSGGDIWHSVERVIGEKPRITVGGFISFSKDNKKLYFWS